MLENLAKLQTTLGYLLRKPAGHLGLVPVTFLTVLPFIQVIESFLAITCGDGVAAADGVADGGL